MALKQPNPSLHQIYQGIAAGLGLIAFFEEVLITDPKRACKDARRAHALLKSTATALWRLQASHKP